MNRLDRVRRWLTGALAVLLCSGLMTAPAYAAGKGSGVVSNTAPVKLVIDGEYLEGKVNDPVSRKTQKAYIINDNVSFHLETQSSAIAGSDIIVYSNEFVEGQDRGVRNRVLSKHLTIDESVQLLPEEYYANSESNGTLYDFTNRCFDVRVYMNSEHTQYEDVYFNVVDADMFSEMEEQAQQKAEQQVVKEQKLVQQYGPAAAAVAKR